MKVKVKKYQQQSEQKLLANLRYKFKVMVGGGNLWGVLEIEGLTIGASMKGETWFYFSVLNLKFNRFKNKFKPQIFFNRSFLKYLVRRSELLNTHILQERLHQDHNDWRAYEVCFHVQHAQCCIFLNSFGE